MVEVKFDYMVSSELKLPAKFPQNLAELIFEKLDSRDEESSIILSHDGPQFVEISLKHFRYIIYSLYKEFAQKGIEPGETVLLASISGSNELYTALMFAALSSYGVRVLLPLFIEIEELMEWLEKSNCYTALLPETDINSLHYHDYEKDVIRKIKQISSTRKLVCHDIFTEFRIREYLFSTSPEIEYSHDELYQKITHQTSLQTAGLLITTSGSTGKSKLIEYCQGAYVFNCLSWEQAGLFNKDILGGRCFTPMFSHTIGIRTFFNALWTGNPICIVNTEWFLEKPETVRYLLMRMRPEHITGGPSIYNLLLELMRCFPELKSVLHRSFKSLVSSGAPMDQTTVEEIESAFGLKMNNAFGTTETQQVLSSLVATPESSKAIESLGAPLPGVKIGLKRLIGEHNLYELHVHSKFGMKSLVEGSYHSDQFPRFYNTGDIVELDSENSICYVGRDKIDFIKDGFGVKIPVKRLQAYYEDLLSQIDHIEFFPVKGVPGLATMLFIQLDNLGQGVVSSPVIIRKYAGIITEVNNHLMNKLERFEFRHRSIVRFLVINSKVPTTVKGNVSTYKIGTFYKDEIADLINPLGASSRSVCEIESIESLESLFSHHHNSYYGKMLAALSIDYTYHKSKKDSLYTILNGQELEILDFTGGFGTNLLGHNNERIKKVAIDFLLNDEVAISDQGSIQHYAGKLAEKLNLMVGKLTKKDYNVVFGSTGSEAVEIAIHHAMEEWRRAFDKLKGDQYEMYGLGAGDLVKEIWQENTEILRSSAVFIISLKTAFHGHSTGARALLGNNKKRERFGNLTALKSIFIDDKIDNFEAQIEDAVDNSKIKLKKVVWKENSYQTESFHISSIIGAIAEPVLGEGGIRVVDSKILNKLAEYDFPLIMDEIQCGLGRSGSFIASMGVNANYYLFAKALGGNIEKISAVLIEKHRYVKSFPEYYSSTFANGGLAAKVAIETLSIIEEEEVDKKAKEKGEIIGAGLEKLKARYPQIIGKITGRGLMRGIQIKDFSQSDEVFLRCFYNERYLGLFFSAYILLKHNIRLLPSISSPNVIRVEPSVYITEGEIEKLINAFDDLCEKIANNEIYELFKPFMDNDPFEDNRGSLPEENFMYTGIEKAEARAVKVGIIAHFVYPISELRAFDRDLCQASDTGLRILVNRFQTMMQGKPFVLFSKNILHGRVHFSFIALPIDSAELEKRKRQSRQGEIIEWIQDAVNLAEKQGIQTVSLGAFTSIISNNGLSLVESKNTRIVTGNTLTAASGFHRLKNEIMNRSWMDEPKILGVVGASGNIGSVLSRLFVESEIEFEQLYLFGRNTRRMNETYSTIQNDCQNINQIQVKVVDDLSYLKKCNVIVVASNSNVPIIYPHHICRQTEVLISDLSIPRAVAEEVYEMANVVSLNFASYIQLPNEDDFIISSHTPKGTVFCCAAEGILNGLEPIDCNLKGKITIDGVRKVTQLALKYNFFDQMREAVTVKRL